MATQAWLTQGLTDARNSIKTLVTHVMLNSDATTFNAGQTSAAPGGSTLSIVKAVSESDVDAVTTDFTISITGGSTSDGVGTIFTIALGNSSASTDALTRYVRSNGIGLEDGDVFTVGLRNGVGDANA